MVWRKRGSTRHRIILVAEEIDMVWCMMKKSCGGGMREKANMIPRREREVGVEVRRESEEITMMEDMRMVQGKVMGAEIAAETVTDLRIGGVAEGAVMTIGTGHDNKNSMEVYWQGVMVYCKGTELWRLLICGKLR